MKILILSLCFFISYSSYTQVEFGAIGSSWNYQYEQHSGNGGGWTKIIVTGDTIDGGIEQKVLHRVTYRYTWPPFEERYDSSYLGLMKITDDSIYVNEKLILDHGMDQGDSIIVESEETKIKLGIDSISTVNINGTNYKQWHGKEFCVESGDPNPFGEFEIIENIGQVGTDYLLWDSDGCILGGGTHTFLCYQNGQFQYPEILSCGPFIVSTIDNPAPITIAEIKVYPNPFSDIIHFENTLNPIQQIKVFSMEGHLIKQIKCTQKDCTTDLSDLRSGIYNLQLESSGRYSNTKIVKL